MKLGWFFLAADQALYYFLLLSSEPERQLPPCLLITDFITSPFICFLSEQFTFHPLGAFLDETPFISHHNAQ